mmetsp:Transcript_2858/g.5349  ORF Transcript_2858/g.5349 Transcript_2858/m.5349 type:complete len:306 (+) Transcript_2858:3304-4221(+)
MLREAHDIHVRLGVLAGAQFAAAVQQVEELPAVDLEERHHDLLCGLQPVIDVAARLIVEPQLKPWLPHHRVRLATAGLAKGKAGGSALLKDGIHKGLRGSFVDILICVVLVKHFIKHKVVPLRVLGQVHLHLGDHQRHVRARVRAAHVLLAPPGLGAVQRPLAHANANAGGLLRSPLPRWGLLDHPGFGGRLPDTRRKSLGVEGLGLTSAVVSVDHLRALLHLCRGVGAAVVLHVQELLVVLLLLVVREHLAVAEGLHAVPDVHVGAPGNALTLHGLDQLKELSPVQHVGDPNLAVVLHTQRRQL